MNKCENCFKFGLCSNILGVIGINNPKTAMLDADCAKDCSFYKDKALIVELPCKVGDTVFYINTRFHIQLLRYHVYEATVARIVITRDFVSLVIQIRDEFGCTEIPDIRDFGKTVFFTREEAEKVLKEHEKNDGN